MTRLMSVDEAVSIVLGDKVARAITLDQGAHWAFVAAVAAATTDMDPRALKVIRARLAELKAARQETGA